MGLLGVVQVMVVEFTMLGFSQGMAVPAVIWARVPRFTSVTPRKLVPVMVMRVPPRLGPEAGEMEVMVGVGTGLVTVV